MLATLAFEEAIFLGFSRGTNWTRGESFFLFLVMESATDKGFHSTEIWVLRRNFSYGGLEQRSGERIYSSPERRLDPKRPLSQIQRFEIILHRSFRCGFVVL